MLELAPRDYRYLWPETRPVLDDALYWGRAREVTSGEVQWMLEESRAWCKGYYYETTWFWNPTPRPWFRLVLTSTQARDPKVQEWLRDTEVVIANELDPFLRIQPLSLSSLYEPDPFWFPMPNEKPAPKADPSPKSKVPRFVRAQQPRLDGRAR